MIFPKEANPGGLLLEKTARTKGDETGDEHAIGTVNNERPVLRHQAHIAKETLPFI